MSIMTFIANSLSHSTEKIGRRTVWCCYKFLLSEHFKHNGVSGISEFFCLSAENFRRGHLLMFVSIFPYLLYSSLACFKISEKNREKSRQFVVILKKVKKRTKLERKTTHPFQYLLIKIELRFMCRKIINSPPIQASSLTAITRVRQLCCSAIFRDEM